MRYLIGLFLATASTGLADKAFQPGVSLDIEVSSRPLTLLPEEAFPLTRELFEESYRWHDSKGTSPGSYRVTPEVGIRIKVPAMKAQPVKLDFAFPIDVPTRSKQIDIPIRFDARPTLAAVSYLR